MIDHIVFDVGNVLAAFQWQVRFRRYAESEEMLERLAAATVGNGAGYFKVYGKLRRHDKDV